MNETTVDLPKVLNDVQVKRKQIKDQINDVDLQLNLLNEHKNKLLTQLVEFQGQSKLLNELINKK